MDLAAFYLLLGFDLVERELESTGGCQPGLQQGELNKYRNTCASMTSEKSAGLVSAGKQVAVAMFLR